MPFSLHDACFGYVHVYVHVDVHVGITPSPTHSISRRALFSLYAHEDVQALGKPVYVLADVK